MNIIRNLFTKNIKYSQLVSLCLTILLITCASLCTATIPLALKKIIDGISTHKNQDIIFHLIFLYALVLVLEKLFNESQFLSYSAWENAILKNAYKVSFSSLINNDPYYFKNKLPGTITTQLCQAISGLDSLMFDLVFKTLPLLINFVFIIASIIYCLDAYIAVIILIGTIIYLAIMKILNKKLVRHQISIRESNSLTHGIITDLLLSWKDIKLTNSYRFINLIFNQQIDSLLAKYRIFYFKRGIFGFIQSAIICSVVILVNYHEINKYLYGSVSPGNILLVNNYLILLFKPLESFSLIIRGLSKNYTDFIAIKDIINYKKEKNIDNIELLDINSIHLSNIKIHNLIKNINLIIKKGEKIAIIGQSGSGKSTLMNILAGLYIDFEGEIYINNNQNKIIDPKKLRKYIAYCNSDARLINQSISNNISLGKNSDIHKLIKYTKLNEKINSLQNGINTELHEKSEILSTGELQRIKIARTLALDRSFEIYDESTSALDEKTTEIIIDQLISRKNKSIIFVTHNTKFLNKFDKIYSLFNGLLFEINKDEAHARY